MVQIWLAGLKFTLLASIKLAPTQRCSYTIQHNQGHMPFGNLWKLWPREIPGFPQINVNECCHCSEHESLIVEAILTWRTITLYGLALDYYNSARPSLITRLQQETNTHIRSSIICLLSAFLSAAASGGNSKPSVTFRYQAHIKHV